MHCYLLTPYKKQALIIMPNFEKLLKQLSDHNVTFVLIGGFAATAHGATIVTHDLDICAPFSKDNSEKLLNALLPIHPILRDSERPLRETPESLSLYKNLYLETDYGALDILGSVTGIGVFSEVANHCIEISLFNRTCRVLDIDALIRAKKAMNQPKDKETIIQLNAIKERHKL